MNALLIATDQSLSVILRDQVTEAYINDATVTARVLNMMDEEVTGEDWPLSMPYQTDSDGLYIGELPDSLELELGRRYWVEIKAYQGLELLKTWRELMPARYQNFSE